MGVDHSTVAYNGVERNAGGILLTDETAPNHDNVITRNTVGDNAFDCGITLASHPPYPSTVPKPFGAFHNTISENNSFLTPLELRAAERELACSHPLLAT
jgi:hypothetical protein